MNVSQNTWRACVIAAMFAGGGPGAASAGASGGTPVRLTYEGATVPKGQLSYIEVQESLSGLSCEGYTYRARTGANPAATVRIANFFVSEPGGPHETGGGEAVQECRTSG